MEAAGTHVIDRPRRDERGGGRASRVMNRQLLNTVMIVILPTCFAREDTRSNEQPCSLISMADRNEGIPAQNINAGIRATFNIRTNHST